MGEIADMHVEAYAAGLDPNEMDGTDWADFYDSKDGHPPTIAELIGMIGMDCRMILTWIDDLDGEEEFDCSTENRAEVLVAAVPEFPRKDAETLVALLVKLNDATVAAEKRLEEDE